MAILKELYKPVCDLDLSYEEHGDGELNFVRLWRKHWAVKHLGVITKVRGSIVKMMATH